MATPQRRSEVGGSATDIRASDATSVAYGLALGAGTLILPLLAIESGYSEAEVGLLTATSAAAQISVRLVLGAAMRRFPDRALITAAGLFLLVSFGVIGASTAVVPFVVTELLHGASRACFWTGLQTHVVRGDASIVRNLARVNMVANVGVLLGPIGAGFLIDRSTGAALLVAAAFAAAATAFSLGLQRLPPFLTADVTVQSPLFRRRGVATGCLAVGVAGSWRGFIGSYAPVVLGQGGASGATIGVLVAGANAATTASSGVLARIHLPNVQRVIALSSLAVAASSGVIGFVASSTFLATVCLVTGGVGAGALHILGSAVASQSVHEEERGEAIAVTGTFRAVAVFSAPAGVAGLLQLTTLAPALAVTGLLLTAPALAARRLGA